MDTVAHISRALVSVSDKSGIVDFCEVLAEMGVEILSTGGTMRALQEAGVPVTAVDEYTGFPEMMDGRVKTLHPKVHGGLLALRDNEQHMAQAKANDVQMIDMVVVNLYPFEQTIAQEGVTLEEAVEQIDIGGPSMVRSASKNFRHVTIVPGPEHYDRVLAEMREYNGETTLQTRKELALAAFEMTCRYDAAISSYLRKQFTEAEGFPTVIAPKLRKVADLRYGENPHQSAALYQDLGANEPGVAGAVQLHGKELSFNNYLDLTAALESARDFEEPTAIIIKHLNPCGAASADTLALAFEDAYTADPVSAFGSVLGFNRVVDAETADQIFNSDWLEEVVKPRFYEESGLTDLTIIGAFVEAIIAPGYDHDALEILRGKSKMMRIMLLEDFAPAGRVKDLDMRSIPGGMLVQDRDYAAVLPEQWQIVTEATPTDEQIRSMVFADRIAKHVKSNAIVLVQGTHIVGCGAGQMSRVDSSIIAARKAGDRAMGAVLASDAMFPARDGLDAAAATGCSAIIQPGGSRRDDEVIEAANEHGIPMVMTGMRHFWH
ncbi:MAG: bifunctional phosphoribosylaminoimidazolecarboxamide formyltransferase/IMP cyclohydrolase [candidate division WS1 bacterium]|nr:bifunctional phosphoribosylaminoimidazolecarboxamide formyltransferase/IMP cyclohydrolase [candidate division WS1 bacterium]